MNEQFDIVNLLKDKEALIRYVLGTFASHGIFRQAQIDADERMFNHNK